MCCSTCDFGVPRKWQAWKDSTSASIFCETEKNSTETLKTLNVAFGEQTVGRTQAMSGVLSSKAACLLLKMLNMWDNHQWANSWKCGLCEGIYPPKQKKHYLWNHEHAGNFTWVSSENYERWMIWKVGFRGLASLPWQYICSLCFFSTWISDQEIKWLFLPFLLTTFASWSLFAQNLRWLYGERDLITWTKSKQNFWIQLLSLKQCTSWNDSHMITCFTV